MTLYFQIQDPYQKEIVSNGKKSQNQVEIEVGSMSQDRQTCVRSRQHLVCHVNQRESERMIF